MAKVSLYGTDVLDLLSSKPIDNMGDTTKLIVLHREGGKEVDQGKLLIGKLLVGVEQGINEPSLIAQYNACKEGLTQ